MRRLPRGAGRLHARPDGAHGAGVGRRPLLPVPNPAASLPARHLEILRAAMRLVAERGYAGASLRELARRVGMSQPSLYHYCRSKEDLVEQVILCCGADALLAPDAGELPASLEDFPRFITSYILSLYDAADYQVFVRFMFAVSAHKPRYRNALRRVYEESLAQLTPVLLGPFVSRGELTAEDAHALMRLLVNTVGLLCMERRVVYAEKEHREDTRAFAAWVSQMAEHLVRTVLRQRAAAAM
ncbi:MAG: TetR/AcrR family transcriptional regulator [Deltaproteobacteria bacterium]|nr:TetR/AcrR family transcriptional regulator [Deltaproteobacteria bacterium]